MIENITKHVFECRGEFEVCSVGKKLRRKSYGSRIETQTPDDLENVNNKGGFC